MGHFGFSYIGVLYLLMLFIPNLIWTRRQPEGYEFRNENKLLVWCERVGQVGVSCCALILLLYEGYWVRYFRSGQKLKDFYSSFCGVPLAGATLPVVSFLLLGIYGRVIWMVVFVVILGIGHIGIHWQHFRELRE